MKQWIEEKQARELLVQYGKLLVQWGLVQGTWGNLSTRLDEETMLVTPSGMDYMRLSAEDMVKVNILTLQYDGSRKPTSEKAVHAAIYQKRKDIGAVIHTHSTYCSVFAAAHRDLPVEEKGMRDIFGDKVKVADYGFPGTEELMENTVQALGNRFACLMANHGMVTCGADIRTAFENCRKLEDLAREYIDSRFFIH